MASAYVELQCTAASVFPIQSISYVNFDIAMCWFTHISLVHAIVWNKRFVPPPWWHPWSWLTFYSSLVAKSGWKNHVLISSTPWIARQLVISATLKFQVLFSQPVGLTHQYPLMHTFIPLAGKNPYDISKDCDGPIEETLCYPVTKWASYFRVIDLTEHSP